MATTTFSGPVVSDNGFVSTTGFSGPDTLTTEAGTGITTGTGTVIGYKRTKVGNIITTHIFIDVTGLRSEATDGDIIGVDGGTANCHLGRITTADCGFVFAGSMTCLETPAGGDPNIVLYSADESTGAENAAITGLTETVLYDKNGDWAAGNTAALTAVPDMSVGEYLYLVQGDATGTNATYTAGQFLIELVGYEA